MEKEIWRDIEGYEGKYQISNLGRVKSLNYKRTGREQYLNPQKNTTNGYLQVNLRKNGKKAFPLIHRLVANAFIQNTDNLLEVNHKDENPENNRLENLEWCDSKYNNNYGTAIKRRSKKMVNNKKISKQVLCIETNIIYPSINEAQRQTGIYQSNIVNCCNGKRKSTGGYHWKYV